MIPGKQTRKRSGILLAAFLFAVPAAGAEDCAPVDYRKELPPVRNQSDSSLCFAYTAADLVGQRIGKNVSAAYMAANFALVNSWHLPVKASPELQEHLKSFDWRSRVDQVRASVSFYDRSDECLEPEDKKDREGIKNIDGGEEDIAILLANINGVCLESDFPSTGKLGFTESDLVAASKRGPETDAYMQEAYCGLVPHAQPFYKKGYLRQVLQSLKAREDPWVSDTLHLRWLSSRCKPVKPERALIPEVVSLPGDRISAITEGKFGISGPEQKKLFSALDGALDGGKIAAIGYNSSIIEKQEPGEKDECNKHSSHSSVIAARRKNPRTGACEYLIRNSWGASCGEYRKTRAIYCDERDPGNIWISKKELAKGLFGVVQLR